MGPVGPRTSVSVSSKVELGAELMSTTPSPLLAVVRIVREGLRESIRRLSDSIPPAAFQTRFHRVLGLNRSRMVPRSG